MLAAGRWLVRVRPVVDDPLDEPVGGELQPDARVLVLAADLDVDEPRGGAAVGEQPFHPKGPGARVLGVEPQERRTAADALPGLRYLVDDVRGEQLAEGRPVPRPRTR